jgi:hypothetical protein
MASASPSAAKELRVIVQFAAAHGGQALYPDKEVELRVLQQAGAAFAVGALFNALDIPQGSHERYDVQDLEARSLSGAQLAALTDANAFLRIVRKAKRSVPVSDDAQTPAHGRGSAGAGGPSAGGASASARGSGGGSAARAAKAC